MDFLATLSIVALMLLYAVPGFIMMKGKMFPESAMSIISKILIYVCQPCFSVYAFNKLDFSWGFLGEVLLFMGAILVLQIIILLSVSTLYKSKWESVKYRICTIASCFGNCVFFGAPVLEKLMPHFPEAIVYANAYAVVMNILCWTIGSTIITGDKKYVSVKKVFLNPGTIGFILAILFYALEIRFNTDLQSALSLLGRMTTPLSMMVLGMRLATVKIKPIFATPLFYFTVFLKQFVYPMIAFFLFSVLSVSRDLLFTAFILCCCPVASVVLNFSEMLGEGQENAADILLLSTMLSIVTMPLMLLML